MLIISKHYLLIGSRNGKVIQYFYLKYNLFNHQLYRHLNKRKQGEGFDFIKYIT